MRRRVTRRLFTFCVCIFVFLYNTKVASNLGRSEPSLLASDEPAVFTPVTFDKTRHTATREVGEFNNLALAPANVECRAGLTCREQLYLVFIRCNESPRKRWGEMNIVGLANFSAVGLDRNPYAVSKLKPPQVKRQSYALRAPVRSHYQSLLAEVAKTHQVYSDVLDRSLWVAQMHLLEDTRDVRIFHVGNETCVVTTRLKIQVFVICYAKLHEYVKADNSVRHSYTISNPTRTVRVKRGVRNIVPLVQTNHHAWTNNSANIWLLDAMGSNQRSPVIFPVSLLQSGEDIFSETKASFDLQRCEHFQGWRGNTPVIKLTHTIWITIVHKRVRTFPSLQNHLGRRYENRVMLLESEVRDGPPARCADQKYEQNIVSTKPFVYLLGLVHVGMKETHGGEYHTFISTGAVDDFMPVLHTFKIFLPRVLLETTMDALI